MSDIATDNRINYDLKSKVLKEGLVDHYKRISKAKYAEYVKVSWGEIIPTSYHDINEALEDEAFFISENKEEWLEAGKVAHADYKRTKLLRHKIQKMLDAGDCVFATLTFTDDTLNKTSVATRRRYVTRYLKSQQGTYIANIDYGGKNGREHYHAVVLGRLDPKQWEYGALNVKKIIKASKPVKLAKYVNKLTNHAIKETCKRNAIIYSRDFEKPSSAVLEPSRAILAE